MTFQAPTQSNTSESSLNICTRCGAQNPFVNTRCGRCDASLNRHQKSSNNSVPFAIPSPTSPSPVATKEPGEANLMQDNYWQQATGIQGQGPTSVVATASFPNLTPTTGTLPMVLHPPSPYRAPRRSDGRMWKFSMMAIAAVAVGAVAGRVLLTPRPVFPLPAFLNPATGQNSIADTQAIQRRLPPPQSPVQHRLRQQRAYWRGYSSRPDQTAGSPPSPYAEALRSQRVLQRRTVVSRRS